MRLSTFFRQEIVVVCDLLYLNIHQGDLFTSGMEDYVVECSLWAMSAESYVSFTKNIIPPPVISKPVKFMEILEIINLGTVRKITFLASIQMN